MNNMSKKQRKKLFRKGKNAVIITSVSIIAVLLINIAVNLLPSSSVKFSVSTDGIYDISDESREIMSGVKDSVTVYVCSQRDTMDKTVLEYVKRYCELSKNVECKTVDPTVDTEFITKYTSSAVSTSDTTVFVVNNKNERVRIIPYSNLYFSRYTSQEIQYYQMLYDQTPENPTYFAVEPTLASAIRYVTAEKIPTIYYTAGHGEIGIDSTVSGLCDQMGYSIAKLSLSTAASIPEDASVIIVNGASADFAENELSLLRNYLNRGGHVIMTSMYNTSIEDRNLKGLYGLTEEFGLKYRDLIVFEGNEEFCYNKYPDYIIPQITANSYSQKLPTDSVMLLSLCNAIEIAETENAKVTALMTTTESGYAREKLGSNPSADKQEGDIEGKFTLAAQSVINGGGSLTWFASPIILNGSTVEYGFGDIYYFLAVTEEICGDVCSVSIGNKQIVSERLTVSDEAAKLWNILFIAVIPIALLAFGASVFYSRKRR